MDTVNSKQVGIIGIGVSTFGSKIFVPERECKRVIVLDDDSVSYIETGDEYPRDTCVSKDGSIIVIALAHSILVYNEHRELLNQFGSKGTGMGQFNEIAGICIDSQSRIIVSDYFNQRIQTFTTSGQFVHSFQTHESITRSERIVTSGMCVDAFDNILVSNGRHKVH